ncbi:MAG TPA: hypothetical protein VNS55_00245 [Nocardioides sp.]|nr:hypothetical protein [Nocardioides sp.]
MRKTITSTAVALSAAALTVGLAGAAHADLYGVDDPQDTFHGSDVLALSVRNGADNVHVTTYHDNLVRKAASGSGEAVYIDTDPGDRGPEYVLAAGLFEGTDYLLSHTEGFGVAKWGKPVAHGDYILHISYRKDRAHAVISRASLGNPDEIRVAVRASGTRTDGTHHGLVDWVGKDRRFGTPWIAQG